MSEISRIDAILNSEKTSQGTELKAGEHRVKLINFLINSSDRIWNRSKGKKVKPWVDSTGQAQYTFSNVNGFYTVRLTVDAFKHVAADEEAPEGYSVLSSDGFNERYLCQKQRYFEEIKSGDYFHIEDSIPGSELFFTSGMNVEGYVEKEGMFRVRDEEKSVDCIGKIKSLASNFGSGTVKEVSVKAAQAGAEITLILKKGADGRTEYSHLRKSMPQTVAVSSMAAGETL